MKILIWIVTFLVFSIVNTLVKDSGVTYSLASLISPDNLDGIAIFSGLFYGLFVAATYGIAFYLARKLCKHWDDVKWNIELFFSRLHFRRNPRRVLFPNFRRWLANVKGWHIIAAVIVAAILLGSVGMNIYLLGKTSVDAPATKAPVATTTIDPAGETLSERAAYILDYYDARIDNLNINLSFKASYFTPIDIDSLGDSFYDRFLLSQIEEYGYLPQNKYGEAKGKKVGDSITTLVADFDRQIEAFRTYTSDYAGISKEEARNFFVDLEVWCGSSLETAEYITSTLDSYDSVLNSSWHSRIDTILEELLKVQSEMLAISEDIYKAKQ